MRNACLAFIALFLAPLQLLAQSDSTVSQDELATFRQSLHSLRYQIELLKQSSATSVARIADAEIFVKAAEWAIDLGPVVDTSGRD